MRRRRASETAKTTAVRAPFPPATGKRGQGGGASPHVPRRLSSLSLRRIKGEPGGRALRRFLRRPQAILPGDGKNRPLFLPATAQKGSFYRPGGRTKSGFSPHNGRCNCCFLWITSVIFGITPLNPPVGGPNGGVPLPARARERGKLSTVPQFVTTAFHKKISPYPQPISRQ